MIWSAIGPTQPSLFGSGFGVVHAQSAGPHFTDWSVPVPVSELNTTASESPNSISRDGLSLYINFVNPVTPTAGEDIYVAHRDDANSEWGSPVIVPNVNSNKNDRHAFISPDGHWLYFASNRTGGLNNSYDIYVSWRQQVKDDQGWETPTRLSVVNTTGFDVGPRLFGDESIQLYFSSNPFANAQPADIYRSVLGPDGFGTPVSVSELNSAFHEGACYLRKDGREIYFPRTEGIVQNVMNSTRESTDALWAAPEYVFDRSLIGDPAITFITNPVLSWDALTLYIGVYQTGVNNGNADIYVSHREKLRGNATSGRGELSDRR
jgi:hypothetical protein